MFSINKSNNSTILLLSFGILEPIFLIFQVVFAKNLILLFCLTAPAIATMLAVYFSGMALGSFIFGKLADHFSTNITQKFYLKFCYAGKN